MLAERSLRPSCGGSYDVFKERPLSQAIFEYLCVDVLHFEYLENLLFHSLPPAAQAWVIEQSQMRVNEVFGPMKEKGPHRAIAPAAA